MGTKYEMVKVSGKGKTGFTYEGEEYAPDKNGIFEIPRFLLPLAKSHGFAEVK